MGRPPTTFWLDDVRLDGILRVMAERDELTAAAKRVCECRYSARDAEIANLSEVLRRQGTARERQP